MRKFLDRVLPYFAGLCVVLACGVFVLIVYAILIRGLPVIVWNFLTDQIRLVGAAGGIFFNLLGTLILIGTALLVSAPLATGIALVHGVCLRNSPSKRHITVFLQTLNGVPSILFGLFGLIVFVNFFELGKSWLTGGILLGVMMLPTVSVSLADRVGSIPDRYLEAAASLGLRQSQVIWSVVMPQARAGLLTGALLGLARAAGETAPIMFTATIFAGATWPSGIRDSPVLSLPYHIFVLAQDSFDPEVGSRLWGAAAVLLGLVFLLSLVALPARLRVHEEANG